MRYEKINEGKLVNGLKEFIQSLKAKAVKISSKSNDININDSFKKLEALSNNNSKYKKFKDFKIKQISINKAVELVGKDRDEFNFKNDGELASYSLNIGDKIIAIYGITTDEAYNPSKEYMVKVLDNSYDETFIEAIFEAYIKKAGDSLRKIINIKTDYYNDDINPSIYYCSEKEYKEYENILNNALGKLEKEIDGLNDYIVTKKSNGYNITSNDGNIKYNDIVNKIIRSLKSSNFDQTNKIKSVDSHNKYNDIYTFNSKDYGFIKITVSFNGDDSKLFIDIAHIINNVKLKEAGMFANANLLQYA